MSSSSSVTRGGVTYQLPQPTLRADEEVIFTRSGSAARVTSLPNESRRRTSATTRSAPARSNPAPSPWLGASRANDENRVVPTTRAGLVSGEELAGMWATLDLADRDDLRVAALFILLCAGLRKSEIVALDFGDLSEQGQTLQLRVRATRANGPQERVISFDGDPKLDVLRRYLSAEHPETRNSDAPLLWTLGRHGTCRRQRITTHALSYWVSQLQRRAGIERRLSPHAFRRAWLAAGLETG